MSFTQGCDFFTQQAPKIDLKLKLYTNEISQINLISKIRKPSN